jgi:hypothetical protein
MPVPRPPGRHRWRLGVLPLTFEVYPVAPGTDVEAALPPLPDSRTAEN